MCSIRGHLERLRNNEMNVNQEKEIYEMNPDF
jgi:hypothetical protein